jgi:hypothetical protein
MSDLLPHLAKLAARINAEHHQAETARRAGLQHAKNAGELLIKAKEQCRYGEWLPWLRANVELSERTAQAYMQIAKRWEELEAKAQRVADLPYRDGLKLLADPAPASPLEVLQAATTLFKEASAALKAGDASLGDEQAAAAEQTTAVVREVCASLRGRIDAPDITITELKTIQEVAADLQQAAAEYTVRVERRIGELLETSAEKRK